MADFDDTAAKNEKVEIEVSPQAEQTHDTKFEKRVLRKIDVRLLPILGALYTISLVDRSNISVARISGLDEDVGLDIGSRASIALMVFFIVGTRRNPVLGCPEPGFLRLTII